MTTRFYVVNPETGNFLTPSRGWDSSRNHAWSKMDEANGAKLEAMELAKEFGAFVVAYTEGTHDRSVVVVAPNGDTMFTPRADRRKRFGSSTFGPVEFNWPGSGNRDNADLNAFVAALRAVQAASRIL